MLKEKTLRVRKYTRARVDFLHLAWESPSASHPFQCSIDLICWVWLFACRLPQSPTCLVQGVLILLCHGIKPIKSLTIKQEYCVRACEGVLFYNSLYLVESFNFSRSCTNLHWQLHGDGQSGFSGQRVLSVGYCMLVASPLSQSSAEIYVNQNLDSTHTGHFRCFLYSPEKKIRRSAHCISM